VAKTGETYQQQNIHSGYGKLHVNYLQLHVEQICLTFKVRGAAPALLAERPARPQC
jgi:hypothetical protein